VVPGRPQFARYSPILVCVPSRACRVSFIDHQGITHSVEVVAESLYEAVALALAEFARCGFTDASAGSSTAITVAVKSPVTTHEIKVGKFRDWLDASAKSPRERVLKDRLKELVGG
jgi:hypothetical protein